MTLTFIDYNGNLDSWTSKSVGWIPPKNVKVYLFSAEQAIRGQISKKAAPILASIQLRNLQVWSKQDWVPLNETGAEQGKSICFPSPHDPTTQFRVEVKFSLRTGLQIWKAQTQGYNMCAVDLRVHSMGHTTTRGPTQHWNQQITLPPPALMETW